MSLAEKGKVEVGGPELALVSVVTEIRENVALTGWLEGWSARVLNLNFVLILD
jgi:hypothetical protein